LHTLYVREIRNRINNHIYVKRIWSKSDGKYIKKTNYYLSTEIFEHNNRPRMKIYNAIGLFFVIINGLK